ncbi:hypothetical protein POZ03_16705 [Bacteroides uniformis]|uniref:hypothetical protein n=1 Tax=Bacteroides uniformis TaxID=820 RepID=UPI00233F4A4E|nr:hypothetical protein [Bacteroides uniformis]MDC1812101.1 hypothetical protein [Bacteroides uniformis]
MENEQKSEKPKKLTDEEELFCQLYINGGVEYAGQHVKCYKYAFQIEEQNVSIPSRQLLSKPSITTRIKILSDKLQSETETVATKLQISETLKAVMEETATSSYTDKFGVKLSPAPLRSVSVNAAKALMDIYPIKHTQSSKLKIEGEGGVTFNVIVPSPEPNVENEA